VLGEIDPSLCTVHIVQNGKWQEAYYIQDLSRPRLLRDRTSIRRFFHPRDCRYHILEPHPDYGSWEIVEGPLIPAEREIVETGFQEPVTPAVIRYMNRLSDLLFVLARRKRRG
jgi:hypothetical protein